MIRKWLFPIAMVVLCAACGSSVPVATTHFWSTQRKMQAARHWEVLAGDLASQVEKYLSHHEELSLRPVYVVPKADTPFEEIFHGLLISELMKRDLVVSRTAEGALEMEYTTQVLAHSDRNSLKYPLKFTTLGTGVIVARNFDRVDAWLDKQRTRDLLAMSGTAGLLADVAMSHYAGEPSHNEIIITTTLSLAGALCLHQSDIYYINDPDVNHYADEDEIEMKGRSYNVVN